MKKAVAAALCAALMACGDSDEKPAEQGNTGDGSTDGTDAADGSDSDTDGSDGSDGADGADGATDEPPARELSSAEGLLFDWLVPGEAKETEVMQLIGSELDGALAAWGAAGFIATAGTTNDAGYTLIAAKDVGSTQKFDTRVEQVIGSELDSTLENIGLAGFVPTVMFTNSAGYTIVSYRPEGEQLVYEMRVEQVIGSELDSTLENFGLGGYVLAASVYNSAGYLLVGAHPKDDATRFGARVEQVVGSELDTTLENFALTGHAHVGSITNDAGYTLFGQQLTGSDERFASAVTQVIGAQLDDTVQTLGDLGYTVTSMVYNSAGYTLFALASEGAAPLPEPAEEPAGTLTIDGVEQLVTEIDCVYYETNDTLSIIATGEEGDRVLLMFNGLPYPGAYDLAASALEASSAAYTVWINVGLDGGINQAVQSGSVYYEDSQGDHFEVLNAMLGGTNVNGDFTCDGLRVE